MYTHVGPAQLYARAARLRLICLVKNVWPLPIDLLIYLHLFTSIHVYIYIYIDIYTYKCTHRCTSYIFFILIYMHKHMDVHSINVHNELEASSKIPW